MAGTKNNPTNRGTKQVNQTVLVGTYGPGLKMHKRFVHSAALASEIDVHLAAGAVKR